MSFGKRIAYLNSMLPGEWEKLYHLVGLGEGKYCSEGSNQTS